MGRKVDEDIEDGFEDWIGAGSVEAYWAAWARIHDVKLSMPNELQEDEPCSDE